MAFPPLWKVFREIRRVGRQIVTFPKSMLVFYCSRHFYDLVLSRRVKRFQGALPETADAAIFLIFPDKGVLRSHILALDYLARKNCATIVVSNLALSSDDRARVLEKCHRYIERPNFGYDFGGYREGVLSLGKRLSQLNQLILLNDSTWFPLASHHDWLADVAALEVDFAGGASHNGTASPEAHEYRQIDFDYQVTHTDFHYTSFALAFSQRVVSDPEFHRFWRVFRMTNEKNEVVRRGEIGLTQWMLARDFTHGSTLDVADLEQGLQALDTPRLKEILENMAIPMNWRVRDEKHSLLADPVRQTREDIIDMILTGAAKQGISYALPDFNIFEKGFSFLKKSPVWLEKESSEITLKMIEKLDGPMADALREETQELRKARAPEFLAP